jgi:hypothetical protein
MRRIKRLSPWHFFKGWSKLLPCAGEEISLILKPIKIEARTD